MTEDKRNYLTVSELNIYIGTVLQDDGRLASVRLAGEVSGISVSGAHAYFTVKDSEAQLPVCIFNYKRVYLPQNGERVMLTGSAEFYAKLGKLSFVAQRVEKFGLGDSFLELEALKAKLAAEGIFDVKNKKPIPKYPLKVVVVTSRTGAVINDITATVRRYNPLIDISILDVRVQGEGAAADIANAVHAVDGLGFDVIIVARGGGSREDLAAYDDERVARTVFNAKTPTISAVGHETDFSICDLAADIRAATPTAAAELIAFDLAAYMTEVQELSNDITFSVKERIINNAENVRDLSDEINLKIERLMADIRLRLARISQRAQSAMSARIAKLETTFTKIYSALDEKSPHKILAKGYLWVTKNGKTVTRITDLAIGDTVKISTNDGTAKAEIKEVKTV